jgi:hypothetical protein
VQAIKSIARQYLGISVGFIYVYLNNANRQLDIHPLTVWQMYKIYSVSSAVFMEFILKQALTSKLLTVSEKTLPHES